MIGGIAGPAIAAAIFMEAGAVDAAVTVGSRISSLINASETGSSGAQTATAETSAASSANAAIGEAASAEMAESLATQTPTSSQVVSDFNAAGQEEGWQLGSYKSDARWANQINSRDWSPEQVTDIIKTGEQSPAKNFINPGNSATNYMDSMTGRFVVKDNNTGEILQISKKGFFPQKF